MTTGRINQVSYMAGRRDGLRIHPAPNACSFRRPLRGAGIATTVALLSPLPLHLPRPTAPRPPSLRQPAPQVPDATALLRGPPLPITPSTRRICTTNLACRPRTGPLPPAPDGSAPRIDAECLSGPQCRNQHPCRTPALPSNSRCNLAPLTSTVSIPCGLLSSCYLPPRLACGPVQDPMHPRGPSRGTDHRRTG